MITVQETDLETTNQAQPLFLFPQGQDERLGVPLGSTPPEIPDSPC
jgi:hypothetical protein